MSMQNIRIRDLPTKMVDYLLKNDLDTAKMIQAIRIW
jgi:hypothetical protein